MPCSCSKGALTFDEARLVKDKLTGGRVGHGVSLRKVLEAEILNYEQGEPTKKAHVTPAGRKVAPEVGITETKRTAAELAAMGGAAETTPVLRPKQSKYVVKVTFDARQITRGLFRVCVQKHRPWRSDVAVHYRGHWFYIAEDDVQSRSTLNLVKLAIDIQSQAGAAGPVLTLPLN